MEITWLKTSVILKIRSKNEPIVCSSAVFKIGCLFSRDLISARVVRKSKYIVSTEAILVWIAPSMRNCNFGLALS